MLHGRRVELRADTLEQRLAFIAIVAVHPHLDELVRHQVDVELVQHGSGESLVADADHGIEVMGAGAQRSALAG